MKLFRMPLPGSSSAAPMPGVGDGDFPCEAALARAQQFVVLDLPHQDARWCADCAGTQTFHVVAYCEAGRIGFCMGCEARKLIPFMAEERLLWPWERTNSEVA